MTLSQAKVELLKFIEMFSFDHRLQDWIRQEVVDDAPCDDESFFPTQN